LSDIDLRELKADCGRCFALCCVAPAFSASADFAIDKKAGQACPNLRQDFGCGVHANLRQRGFKGCTVYDCFGAGQKVAQVTFAGRDWRRAPETAARMFAVFPVMRDLHELLWYLTEAMTLHPTGDLARAREDVERLTRESPERLAGLDVAGTRRKVNVLLRRAGDLARGEHGEDHSGAALVGARLRGADLTGAGLRGTYLIGADLRGADLTRADLTGADLRDADVRGAKLAGAVFLIQSQLDAARGDARTTLPAALTRPAHW